MKRVLLVHNRYQHRGGEDTVFETERSLLRSRGHEVFEYIVSNDAIDGPLKALGASVRAVWSTATYSEVRKMIRANRPDIVHCINTFPLVSPSIYYAARAEGLPVVQSVQNYRLVCPSAQLLRDGRVCEDCVSHRIAIPGVLHRCYRGSAAASMATAAMLATHRLAGTWRNAVSAYLVPTHFMASKLAAGGIPQDRIIVRGNCLSEDPGVGQHDGAYALFVGRVSPEKGIETMLQAWLLLQSRIPLRVVGGPVPSNARADSSRNIEWLGPLPRETALREMQRASMLIFPSIWYEGQPLVLIEALATGLPVVASDLGAMREMFSHCGAGRLFPASDAAALARLVDELSTDADRRRSMSEIARDTYLRRHSAAEGYRSLLEAYEHASQHSRRSLPSHKAAAVVP